MATVFEVRDKNDRRKQLVKKLEVFTDSDWASDQMTRKSTSGAVIMAEGMRLHAHSRGQASVALRSCEAEGIKEALLLQEVLMFAANFVFAILLTILCGESDVKESLGCSLEMRTADVVVSQLQWFPSVRPTHRHHD